MVVVRHLRKRSFSVLVLAWAAMSECVLEPVHLLMDEHVILSRYGSEDGPCELCGGVCSGEIHPGDAAHHISDHDDLKIAASRRTWAHARWCEAPSVAPVSVLASGLEPRCDPDAAPHPRLVLIPYASRSRPPPVG